MGLRKLVVSENMVTDISALTRLSELRYLDVSHNRIETMPALSPRLLYLDASYNSISKIVCVPAMVEHVDLRHNLIADLLQLTLLLGPGRARYIGLSHNPVCRELSGAQRAFVRERQDAAVGERVLAALRGPRGPGLAGGQTSLVLSGRDLAESQRIQAARPPPAARRAASAPQPPPSGAAPSPAPAGGPVRASAPTVRCGAGPLDAARAGERRRGE